MKKILLFSLLLAAPGWLFSQAIVKGSGIVYTNGVPTHTPAQNTDSEFSIDTTTGLWYEWARDLASWNAAGFRIAKLAGSSAPSGTPTDKESEVVLNEVDSLYAWRSGAWRHLNKSLSYSAGTGISISGGNVISNTGDLSATNEGVLGVGSGGATSSVILSNTSGATGVTLQVTGIATISEATSSNGGTITIGATEVDGSTSNELQTFGHAGTTSYTNTLSNGGGSFTLNAGGIAAISHTAGTVTISATEVDGSVSNELQTLANTSDATSHTATLSNSGGSLQLVEGANVTLTTSGTGLNGIVTIAATSGGGADLTYSGASSPVTLNSSTGSDVTITEGGIVSLSATSGNITITATEVDGSVSNELQTLANTSDATSHTATLSNSGGSLQLVEGANVTLTTSGTGLDGIITIASSGGGAGTDLAYTGVSSPVTLTSSTGTDVTITEGGIVSLSATSGNITITATEVDGSVSNELQTYGHAGTTSYTNTLSDGGGSFTLNAGGIAAISHTAGTVTISATEVDGSTTNELQTFGNAGTTSYTNTLSNGGGSFTLQASGIAAISHTAGTVTISATEVDGSTSNELQTFGHAGTTSYTNTLSNGGGSFTLQASGIASISHTAGTTTISATEVDGSTTNELQTVSNTSDATSHTATLSNSGGSLQLVEGANVTLTTSGTGLNGIVTIAATSGGGSDLTYSGASSPVTLNSSSGSDVTITEGGIVSLSATSGNLTISATEVDGSVSNELQTVSNTSDATSHTATLSNSGGSLQLVEGANVTLTTSGTGLNGIVTISASGGGAGTDLAYTGAGSPVTLTSSTGNDVTITEGGIVSLSATSGNITITATEVDGSVSNELQTFGHAGTTSYTNTLSNGGGSFTLQASGIAAISHTAGTVTISATEVDGSVSNELQTVASTSDATSHTLTLSNSGGSLQLVEGANVTLTTSGTGLNGIVTIAATSGGGSDLTFSGASSPVTLNSSSGSDVTFTEGGIVSLSATSGNITITATEVDGSVSNELQTFGHAGTTSYTNTLSNGGGSFTLQASGIASISHTAGTVTISATEVDGSVSNELQTIANTSDATSHTATLSNSGGSLQLVEGANITLTTSGTGLNGIVTIAATSGGGSDLTFSGASSPVTLNSSTGTDVTLTEGGIVTLSATSGNITITATEVDGSVSNELQTFGHAGTTSYTNTLSDGGGSFTLQASGIAAISHTAGTVTISATEVDGSVSNELQTIANTSDATSHTATLSNSGGSLQLVEGANITLTTSGTGLNGIVTIASAGGAGTDLAYTGAGSPVTLTSSTGNDVTITEGGIVSLSATSGNITITATEVDGSVSNELQTFGHAGTTSYTNTLSNGGGSFTLQASGIAAISHTAGTVTISATEVDGSTSNELQTFGNAGTTSYTNTLSNGGGSFTLQASGIAAISHTAGTVTISATEVDGSTSNELQTFGNAGTTSYTNTLSNGGGSFTLQASGIASISHTAGTVTISATEVDGSVSNELQTIANTSDATSHTATLSNSGGSLQLVEGSNITLTTSGTGLNGIVTIAATSGGGSDLTFSGASSPVTLNSSTGTDVTFTQGGIVSLSATSGNITITATEVDGSVSNELQTIANTSNATSHTATLSNSGGSLQLVEGGIITLTTTGTGLNGIVTIAATEVDGSVSNELQTFGHAGTTSYTNTLSNGGGSFTLQASGIAAISHTAGTVTISATEVDGSTSNELQTFGNAGTTSYTNTLSNGGGSFTLQASGIAAISHTAGTVTISATEVDGSVSNEGSLTVSAGGANDSQIASNTSGSTNVTISGGTGTTITESGSTITVTSTATTFNAQTGTSYTLVIGDAGKFVTLSNASGITLTVPPNSSVAFPIGTVIDLAQIAAGQVTVAPGSGVTINSAGSANKTRVQYSGASLVKTDTNVWLLIGDITS